MSRRVAVPFPLQCRAMGIPEPVAEFRFSPPRRWRFDFAWPAYLVALEVEGGVFIRGRHARGAGMVGDMTKYSEAAILGWRLLRVTPQQIADGSAVILAQRALSGGGPQEFHE